MRLGLGLLLGSSIQRGIGRGDDGERGGGLQEIASFHKAYSLPCKPAPRAAGERDEREASIFSRANYKQHSVAERSMDYTHIVMPLTH